jgi:sugar/nucleoside kinase (ribokinase family)
MKSLFVGLNVIDIQFLVNTYPPSNTKTKAIKNDIYTGGPATNAAITFSYLGGEADLLTPVGKHALTDFIREDLKKQKVRIFDPIAEMESIPSFASVITTENNGDRTIFSYHPENLTQKGADKLMEEIQLEKYDNILVDGFYISIANQIAGKAKRLGIPVIFDGGSWKEGTEELLKSTDIVICSEHFYPPGTETLQDVIGDLVNKKISRFAVTRGSLSVIYFDDGTIKEIPVPKIKAVDTLGAGDVFHGAFCYYYAKELNFAKALEKSVNVAANSCKYFGTREWLHHKNSTS